MPTTTRYHFKNPVYEQRSPLLHPPRVLYAMTFYVSPLSCSASPPSLQVSLAHLSSRCEHNDLYLSSLQFFIFSFPSFAIPRSGPLSQSHLTVDASSCLSHPIFFSDVYPRFAVLTWLHVALFCIPDQMV